MQFIPYPKTPRFRRTLIITEKLDGCNAQVVISARNAGSTLNVVAESASLELEMRVGSRNRWITPGKTIDNFGFAQWCVDNSYELFKLGKGKHFGEWYGRGIARNYGMTDRRFALFNATRWTEGTKPACCEVVPVLAIGKSHGMVETCLTELRSFGSYAPGGIGFSNPEGIIVYHTASQVSSKVTMEHDEMSKGEAEKSWQHDEAR